jgi:hypothetical protein
VSLSCYSLVVPVLAHAHGKVRGCCLTYVIVRLRRQAFRMNFSHTVAVTHDTAVKHGQNDWTVSPSNGRPGAGPLKVTGITDFTDGGNVEGGNGGLHVRIDRVVVVK